MRFHSIKLGFLAMLVLILVYIVAVQKLTMENINSPIDRSGSDSKIFLRLFSWILPEENTVESTEETSKEVDYATLAQKSCRSVPNYIPHKDELLVNLRWAYEWNSTVLDDLVSTVNITTRDTLNLPKLPYLKNVKNPCWLERLSSNDEIYRRDHDFQFSPLWFEVNPNDIIGHEFRKRIQAFCGYRMRCLPYYFIIGPQKTGTTDLFEKMNFHPFLRRGLLKEPHFFPRSKNENNMTLQHYADLFDTAADNIASTYVSCDDKAAPFHPLITGEATAETMWDNWFWQKTPENQGFDDVTYLSAHHIQHLIPQARIIAILRNPVDRLVSDFYYFSHRYEKTAEMLHVLALQAVGNMTECFKSNVGRRACIYNPVPNERPTGSIWNPRVRLRLGLYAEFLEDWYNIFPMQQLHIINFDDYVSNRTDVLDKVYSFLGIEPMTPALSIFIQRSAVDNKNEREVYYTNVRILPETYQLLTEYYAPFNRKLASQTQNNDFLKWNDLPLD